MATLSSRRLSPAARPGAPQPGRQRAGSPATSSVLKRDLPPASPARCALATPSHSATTASSAALASPFSAHRAHPHLQRRALGASRPAVDAVARRLRRQAHPQRRPSPLTAPELRTAAASHEQLASASRGMTTTRTKMQDQDEDDRRDVDAAEVRHEAPDRPQKRLGHAIEQLCQSERTNWL